MAHRSPIISQKSEKAILKMKATHIFWGLYCIYIFGVHCLLEHIGEPSTSRTLPPTISRDLQNESTIYGKGSMQIPASDVSTGRKYGTLTIFEPLTSDTMVYNCVASANVSRLRQYCVKYNINLVGWPEDVLIARFNISMKEMAQ